MILINDCSGSKGIYVSDVIKCRVKNGVNTTFWFNNWIGDQPLVEAFPELYTRTTKPFMSMEETSHWENEEWRWDAHRWFSSEEEEEDGLVLYTVTLLEQVQLVHEENDIFDWAINVEDGFSVHSCAAVIRRRGELPLLEEAVVRKLKMLWNLEAPSKVKVLA